MALARAQHTPRRQACQETLQMTRHVSSHAGNNSCDVNGNLTAGIISAFHLLWGQNTMRRTLEKGEEKDKKKKTLQKTKVVCSVDTD